MTNKQQSLTAYCVALAPRAGFAAALPAAASAQTRVVRPQVPPRPQAIWFTALSGGRTTNGWGHGGSYNWQLSRDGTGYIELPNRRTNVMRRWPFRLTAAQLLRASQHIRAFRGRTQNDELCASDQPIETVRWESQGGTGQARFDHGCRTAQDRAQIAQLSAAIMIMRAAAGALPT